jgi:hypothetical protein
MFAILLALMLLLLLHEDHYSNLAGLFCLSKNNFDDDII